MAVFVITLSTDPQDSLSHGEMLERQKTFLSEQLLPLLVKREHAFHFYQNFIRESEQDSEYNELRVMVKCYWNSHMDEIRHCLYGEPRVTFQTYPDCDVPDCYDPVAARGVEKLKALLFDRYGEGPHPIHLYCLGHLKPQDRAILRTIETVDETPDKHYWTRILVWSWRGCWYAQRVRQDQDGNWETGYHAYVYGDRWQVRKTREAAIQAAREGEGEK